MSDPSLTRLIELRKQRFMPAGLTPGLQQEHDALAAKMGLGRVALREIDKGLLAQMADPAGENNTARWCHLNKMLAEDNQELEDLHLESGLARRLAARVIRVHDSPPLHYDDQLRGEAAWRYARS